MSKITKKLLSLNATLAVISFGLVAAPAAHAADPVVSNVLNVDFTNATVSGNKITNPALGKIADLTINGSPTGVNTAAGLSFPNSVAGSANSYLVGNLGNTTYMSKVEVEITAKFPDDGCAKGFGGSMIFGLGNSSGYVPYNIYRHSGFIGFNTFNSDIYGIALPDTTSYHTYKFVMVPNTVAASQQEIWVDGVKQALSFRSNLSIGAACGTLSAAESSSARTLSSPTYSDGSFTLMTHPVNPNNWTTTGTLKSAKVTTTNTYIAPTAPTIGSITFSNGQLSVPFTAPTSNGGSPITDYKYSIDGGTTWVSAGTAVSPVVIAGLTGGQSYSIKLKAVNSVGDSVASAAATSAILPKTIGVPGVTTVSAGNGKVTVTPTAGPTGNAPTSYTITANPGGASCVVTVPTTSCEITGLTNNTYYTFTTTATNEAGTSAASEATAPVAPFDPNGDVAPTEGDGSTPAKSIPNTGKFVPTNDPTFQVSWNKATGKLVSQATGIYTGYIEGKVTFTVSGTTYTCSTVFGTLKAMPMKTAAQKKAAMKLKTFKGNQFCVDKNKLDPKTTSPSGGMTKANFVKIKAVKKTAAELAQEKSALAALKNFTGEVQIQITRYRAWPTTMINFRAHTGKGGKISTLIRNTKVTL